MNRCFRFYWIILALSFAGCDFQEDEEPSLLIFSKDFDFSTEQHDWIPGFADYPAGPDDSARFELRYAYRGPEVNSMLAKSSIMLSGNNLNGDLFMYLKKRVSGLRPNTDYTITFSVELASNLDLAQYNGTSGSVYLKAGASSFEPESVVASDTYVLNIDKGNHERAGEDMVNLGDLMGAENSKGYTLITLSNTLANRRFISRTDADGVLWLIIGTDSNLKGTTSIYYTRINVVFSAS